MNDNQDAPNPALREAATQTAFMLMLTRNQMACLDAVAHGRREMTLSHSPRGDRLWVPTAHQLGAKGMMQHVSRGAWAEDDRSPTGDYINLYYRLTRAGWLMHDLLAEAGLVQPVSAKKQRRFVA